MTDLSNEGPARFGRIRVGHRYALSRENLSRGRRELDLTGCRVIARHVLEQLRLSRVGPRRAPKRLRRDEEVKRTRASLFVCEFPYAKITAPLR
jgi:hypothetical protein